MPKNCWEGFLTFKWPMISQSFPSTTERNGPIRKLHHNFEPAAGFVSQSTPLHYNTLECTDSGRRASLAWYGICIYFPPSLFRHRLNPFHRIWKGTAKVEETINLWPEELLRRENATQNIQQRYPTPQRFSLQRSLYTECFGQYMLWVGWLCVVRHTWKAEFLLSHQACNFIGEC